MTLEDDIKLYKHLDLTQELKSILGDDVVDYAYSTITGNEIQRGSTYATLNSEFTLNTIMPALNPVVVKLKNGNLFKIWASEWGGITKLESEENLE